MTPAGGAGQYSTSRVIHTFLSSVAGRARTQARAPHMAAVFTDQGGQVFGEGQNRALAIRRLPDAEAKGPRLFLDGSGNRLRRPSELRLALQRKADQFDKRVPPILAPKAVSETRLSRVSI